MTNSLILDVLMLTLLLLSATVALWFIHHREQSSFLSAQAALQKAEGYSEKYLSSLERVVGTHKPSRELHAIIVATRAVMLDEGASTRIIKELKGYDIDEMHSDKELTQFFAELHGVCIDDATIREDLAELIYNSLKYVSHRWNKEDSPNGTITIPNIRNNLDAFIKLLICAVPREKLLLCGP